MAAVVEFSGAEEVGGSAEETGSGSEETDNGVEVDGLEPNITDTRLIGLWILSEISRNEYK
jgi:hypothetical protein